MYFSKLQVATLVITALFSHAAESQTSLLTCRSKQLIFDGACRKQSFFERFKAKNFDIVKTVGCAKGDRGKASNAACGKAVQIVEKSRVDSTITRVVIVSSTRRKRNDRVGPALIGNKSGGDVEDYFRAGYRVIYLADMSGSLVGNTLKLSQKSHLYDSSKNRRALVSEIETALRYDTNPSGSVVGSARMTICSVVPQKGTDASGLHNMRGATCDAAGFCTVTQTLDGYSPDDPAVRQMQLRFTNRPVIRQSDGLICRTGKGPITYFVATGTGGSLPAGVGSSSCQSHVNSTVDVQRNACDLAMANVGTLSTVGSAAIDSFANVLSSLSFGGKAGISPTFSVDFDGETFVQQSRDAKARFTGSVCSGFAEATLTFGADMCGAGCFPSLSNVPATFTNTQTGEQCTGTIDVQCSKPPNSTATFGDNECKCTPVPGTDDVTSCP